MFFFSNYTCIAEDPTMVIELKLHHRYEINTFTDKCFSCLGVNNVHDCQLMVKHVTC